MREHNEHFIIAGAGWVQTSYYAPDDTYWHAPVVAWSITATITEDGESSAHGEALTPDMHGELEPDRQGACVYWHPDNNITPPAWVLAEVHRLTTLADERVERAELARRQTAQRRLEVDQ